MMKHAPTSHRLGEPGRVLTPAAELQFFCRGCKGHDSRTLPATRWREVRCRCGSSDLLIYRVANDLTLAR